MPETDPSQPLPRDQQERFAWLIIEEGKHPADAYKQAGYKPKNTAVASAAATRLLKNVSVKARIAYLRAKRAEKLEITQEGQAKKLENVQAKCLSNGEHSTYVKACEVQNRLYGLDKQVIETPDQTPEMDAAEEALFREFLEWRQNRPTEATGGPSGGSVTVVDITGPIEPEQDDSDLFKAGEPAVPIQERDDVAR